MIKRVIANILMSIVLAPLVPLALIKVMGKVIVATMDWMVEGRAWAIWIIDWADRLESWGQGRCGFMEAMRLRRRR